MKVVSLKFLSLLWIVLLGLMLGGCREEPSLSIPDAVSLDYSRLAPGLYQINQKWAPDYRVKFQPV